MSMVNYTVDNTHFDIYTIIPIIHTIIPITIHTIIPRSIINTIILSSTIHSSLILTLQYTVL